MEISEFKEQQRRILAELAKAYVAGDAPSSAKDFSSSYFANFLGCTIDETNTMLRDLQQRGFVKLVRPARVFRLGERMRDIDQFVGAQITPAGLDYFAQT